MCDLNIIIRIIINFYNLQIKNSHASVQKVSGVFMGLTNGLNVRSALTSVAYCVNLTTNAVYILHEL